MAYGAIAVGLLFISLIVIYLLLGFNIIRINPKGDINRLFLAFCIAMSLWSLGYVMANTTFVLEEALIWRRISAVGWGTAFAMILHFLLLVRHKNSGSTIKRFFILLYIPSLIILYVFAFSNIMAPIQHNLIRVDLGWTNVPVNNGWDWFFYLYYVIYMGASFIIILKRTRKLGLDNQRGVKQGSTLTFSFIFAFVLGSLVDIVSGSLFKEPMPQMAPLLILLPTWVLYYTASHYGVLKPVTVHKTELIVTDQDQRSIFRNIAIAFSVGGLVRFMLEYIPFIRGNDGDIKAGIINGGALLVAGLSIYLFQKIKIKFLKKMLTIMVLVLIIPVIAIQVVDRANVTVWVLPFVIIMSSFIFSKRTLLISATMMAIITQGLIWALKPEATIVINQYDYIARIGMFIIVFSVGFYINKIYVTKIKENENQIAFQKLNSEISLEFVNVHQQNFDEKINQLLAAIGSFFQTDRTYLFLINQESKTMTYAYEWCNEGIEAKVGLIEDMALDVFPWWIEQLKTNEFVVIEDINGLPKTASSEQMHLMSQNVKSLISVSIGGEDGIQGFIGVDSVNSVKKWTKETIKQLNILSNLASHGLAKIEDEKKIEFMAYYDQLTELPNRFLFKDRTNQAINQAQRNGKFVSIMFLDLDNFKAVNDTIGHKGGDYLLKEIAKNLQGAQRKTDTVARFGGDEFMILLTDIADQMHIPKIADKMVNIFSKPFNINGQDFIVTGSVGVSIYPTDGEDAEALIKNADTAMYKAKGKGKNRYALCTADMKEEVKTSMMLSNDLYRALERNELVVYYQPQIDLETGEINGFESLLRWFHPERGLISPGVFIPLAEKNGLINSIGEWVLRTSCVQNKKWQDMNLPCLRMAVNLSGSQFVNPNLAEMVKNILSETGLEAKYLELEITESIAIKEEKFVEGVLNKLKKLGITIAIDDFGTEYSSLSRLKRLPIDRIKIDMQFTQGIELNEKDRAITMVIINLAKSLGLNVIAEGVETKPQMEFLNQKLCDDVQGYFYYKPMPAEQIEKILIEMARKGQA